MCWVWIAATSYNERFETFGQENRLFTFLLMLPVAGFSIFAHHALGENFVGFVLSYTVARVIITALWIRSGVHVRVFRNAATSYAIGFTTSTVLCIPTAIIPGNIKFILIGLALLIDMTTPLVMHGTYNASRFSRQDSALSSNSCCFPSSMRSQRL